MKVYSQHLLRRAQRLQHAPWPPPVALRRRLGRLLEIAEGRLVTDLPGLAIGEICDIRNRVTGASIPAQAVAIRKGSTILAPIGSIERLSLDLVDVVPTGQPFAFRWDPQRPFGVYDALGRRMDGIPLDPTASQTRTVAPRVPPPLDRKLIAAPLETGLAAIDGLLTCGMGQRVAVLGPPGAGKSTLVGSLARNAQADMCVLALIGERGREVQEFLERQLPPEVRSRCIVVVATSDEPPMTRVLAAHVATAMAEYFREQGRHVLLLFDSVTRFARALRDLGLAAGEQPVRRGFTPSVYTELPRLIERSGSDRIGAITAFYTVLVENDGLNDPIAEEVVSLTDGHLTLASKLAHAGHYPAIDVLRSTSRVMSAVVSERHRTAAAHMRGLLARYEDVQLLVQVGEYQEGADPLADEAIRKRPAIEAFLRQAPGDRKLMPASVAEVMELSQHG